ncbi:hypothetical protein NMY22_g287 [Coprinellus aureogranulatus]|nr:hypothetical protein NMY22_g287 [Coprinellus aureogranulatus]
MSEHPSDVLNALFSGNDVPNVIQQASLRKGIEDAGAQIPQLRQRLQELEDLQLQYRWALSPLRRLPLETIGEIIYIAAPDYDEYGARRELLNYVLVCKSWWHASLLKNHLWNRVRINAPKYNTEDRTTGKAIFPKGSYKKIAAWLARAGSVPRTLEVVGSREFRDGVCGGHGNRGPVTDCPWLSPSLRKLLSKGPPLDTLSLSRLGPICFRQLMECIRPSKYPGPRTFDGITSLSIALSFDRSKWMERNRMNEDPFSMFNHLPPHLTTLRLSLPCVHDIGINQFEVPLSIPESILSGLKTFELNSDWDILHAPRLLQHCTNLEHLSLNFRSRDPKFSKFKEETLFEVLLPNLHTLRVQNQYHKFEILKFFRTPALETLEVGFEKILFRHNLTYDELEAKLLSPRKPLCEFAETSGCKDTLRSLRIYGFAAVLGAEELEYISVAYPSLTSLTLDKVQLKSEEFFETFQRNLAGCETVKSIPPTCFPHLQQLQILDCPKKDYCSRSLFAYLRRLHHARRGGDADHIELVMSFADGSGWEELAEEDFADVMEREVVAVKEDPVVLKIVEAEDGNRNWADPDDDGARSHPFARPLDLENIQFAQFTPVMHQQG